MSNTFEGKKLADEGYVYVTYGDKKYLKHVVASIVTLRRYDNKRPVTLFCSDEHHQILKDESLENQFTHIYSLPEENQSIIGFKHHLHQFLPFKKNLFLDSDILWCKDPSKLWQSLSAYRFTITGNQHADLFFGASKGFSVLKDIFLRRRCRTLRRFDISYLSRVQAGMIFSADDELTEKVCVLSGELFQQRHLTHFRSRKEELGRSDESCEWSLAMAMAKMELQVFPWLNGYESPQLDYIDTYTKHDEEFRNVKCLFYSNKFVYDLKGLRTPWLQTSLIRLLSLIPGKGDHLYVTPYCLHFGWYHQKKYLDHFAASCWQTLSRP